MLLLASLSATQPSPCGGFHLGPEVRVNQDSSQGRRVECCVAKNPLTSKNIVVAAMVDGANPPQPYWFIGDYLRVGAGQDGSWTVARVDCRNARSLGHPLNRSADVCLRNLFPEGVLISGAQVSAGAGGSVPLPFQGGERYAGRAYRVLGTAGQEAGFLRGERWIPLDRDTFYELVEARRNGPMFEGFAGTLDGAGRAGPVFTIPPGGTIPPAAYHFVLVTEDAAYMSPIQTVGVVP